MNKLAAILAAIGAISTAQARASDLRMTVEPPHFTCDGTQRFYSRVSFNAADAGDQGDLGAPPLPCCNGKIGCAQFLSTNTIVRQSHEWRG